MTSGTQPPDDIQPPPRPGTRWFTSWMLWLSLLFVGLLLLTVAVCIPTFRRMQAIRYLQTHHCEIEFATGGEWLTERFGEFGTAVRSVRSIRCGGEVNDEMLVQISLLSEVKVFVCIAYISEPLTESGIAAFQSLRNLESLTIHGILETAGDEDLFAALFAERPPLRIVDVDSTSMTVAAFRELDQIESLERVDVFDKQLTREDFQSLTPMPNLQEFCVRFGGEIDVSWLRGSPRLTALSLRGPLVDENLR